MEQERQTDCLPRFLNEVCDGIKEVLDRQCTAFMLVVPKEVEEAFKEYSGEFHRISNRLNTSGDGRSYKTGRQEGRGAAAARPAEG